MLRLFNLDWHILLHKYDFTCFITEKLLPLAALVDERTRMRHKRKEGKDKKFVAWNIGVCLCACYIYFYLLADLTKSTTQTTTTRLESTNYKLRLKEGVWGP